MLLYSDRTLNYLSFLPIIKVLGRLIPFKLSEVGHEKSHNIYIIFVKCETVYSDRELDLLFNTTLGSKEKGSRNFKRKKSN